MIEARDMPFVRQDMMDWYRERGPEMYHEMGEEYPRATAIAEHMVETFATADLYHVNSDMAELAGVAASSLPAFDLQPEDLPSECGLIVFTRPIGHSTSRGTPPASERRGRVELLEVRGGQAPVVGALWSVRESGVGIFWFTTRDVIARQVAGQHSRMSSSAIRAQLPPLAAEYATDVPWGTTNLAEWETAERSAKNEWWPEDQESSAGWLATIKTTWLLMQQPLASIVDAEFTRADRRRHMRVAGGEPKVRVITLRRPSGQATGDGNREYHHQWVVKGHWRQQWLPSREIHRPTWIAPYIKGPEGAPLLGGEKVYALKR